MSCRSILKWSGAVWTYQTPAAYGVGLLAVAGSPLGGDVIAAGLAAGQAALMQLGGWTGAPAAQALPGVVSALPVAVYGLSTDGVCLFYASEVGAGTPAILLTGDSWHAPAYTLYCGGGARLDMCPYDTLEFDIRLDSGPPGQCAYPTLQLSSWSQAGPSLPISPFLSMGEGLPPCVGSAWRHVSIPLQRLGTSSWTLFDVETLSFGNTSAGCTIAADGTRPRPQCEDLLLTNLTLLLVGPPPSPLCAIAVTEFNGGSPPNATQEGLFGGRAVRGLARPLPAPCGVPRPMFYR